MYHFIWEKTRFIKLINNCRRTDEEQGHLRLQRSKMTKKINKENENFKRKMKEKMYIIKEEYR